MLCCNFLYRIFVLCLRKKQTNKQTSKTKYGRERYEILPENVKQRLVE